MLAVHLDGYLNVLGAALPIMAAAGHGHILGVTSGSGWRPADTGAYGCAKRAVAALTWQLGSARAARRRRQRHVADRGDPDGDRCARPGSQRDAGSGAGLGGQRRALARLDADARGARAVRCPPRGRRLLLVPRPGASSPADRRWRCSSEPRLLEVVRTDDVAVAGAPARARSRPACWSPAEEQPGEHRRQQPPRSVRCFDESADGDAPAGGRDARARSSPTARRWRPPSPPPSRPGRCSATPSRSRRPRPRLRATPPTRWRSAIDRVGPLDAVVVALGGRVPRRRGSRGDVGAGARRARRHRRAASTPTPAWARAVADHAAGADRPVRLVTLTDATTAGGRSRAQASAQLARAARSATGDRVAAFAVSIETHGRDRRARRSASSWPTCCAAPSRRRCPEPSWWSAAGWIGLRSHPHPSGSITLGGPASPTGSTPRSGASSAWTPTRCRTTPEPSSRGDPMTRPPDPRGGCPRAPVGSGPHRLVPVPVGAPAS